MAFGIDDAIGAGLGLAESVVGLVNAGKAKKEAQELQNSRPKLKASPYIKDQLSLAESELSTGMSGEAKNTYEQDTDRDLSTSLDAILKGGGSTNNVSELFDRSQQGRKRLTLMKDNLRLAQINNLSRAQQAAEEERQKEFEFNEWAPWSDKAQANAKARQGAEDQIWGGLGLAGSTAMKSVERNRSEKQFDKYFSGGGSSAGNNNASNITPNNSPSMLSELLSEGGAQPYLY